MEQFAKKSSSHEFAEQIRKLEAEGSKLMSSLTNSSGLGLDLDPSDIHVPMSTIIATSQVSPSSLVALADISQEQKTLGDLRSQLDLKMKETEEMTRKLLDNHQVPMTDPSRTSLSTLVLPGSQLGWSDSRLPVSLSLSDYHAKETNEEISQLRQRLHEAMNISEEQKQHFRKTIEDLKTQLQEVIIARDNVLQMKQRELADQESVVHHLQFSSEQLEKAKKIQEMALADANLKLGKLQHECSSLQSAFSQIQSNLEKRDRPVNKAYHEEEPQVKKTASMLVQNIERSFVEFEREMEDIKERNKELELAVEKLKSQVNDQQTHIVEDQNERTRNESKLKMQDERIQNLERMLVQYKEDHEEKNERWKVKYEALQQSLDEVQKELSTTMSERNEAIQKQAATESRYDDMQETINKMKMELDIEKDQTKRLSNQDVDVQRREDVLRSIIHEKEREIERLQNNIASTKQECKLMLHQTEKEEQKRHVDEKGLLVAEVATITGKYHKTQLDYELTKQELKNTKEKYESILQAQDEYKRQLDVTIEKKNQLTILLEEQQIDKERLSQERDYYFSALEDIKNDKLSIEAQLERITIQFEEKERNFATLKQQNDNIANMVEISSKTNCDTMEENKMLKSEISKRNSEVEEVKKAKENIIKKLKIRESSLKDMERELEQNKDHLKEKETELDELQKQKEVLFKELLESRYEVSTLAEDREKMKVAMDGNETEMGKKMSKLTAKLKVAEHDLKLARKALRTKETVDGTAVKVAGKMQKEVTAKRSQIDFLQSQVSWLEECLENAVREKKGGKAENIGLSNKLKESRSKVNDLHNEMNNQQAKQRQLSEKVIKLHAALEKAAVKFASAQAQIAQHEQDTVRLKLKHKLQIKELQRTGKIKASVISTSGDVGIQKEKVQSEFNVDHCVQLNQAEKPYGFGEPDAMAAGDTGGIIGEELRDLLGEMRTLVQEHRQSKMKDVTQSDSNEENTGTSDMDTETNHLRDVARHKSHKSRHTGKPHNVTPLYSETKDLCKRLEKKMDTLSQMGNIQHDKQVTVELMKERDRKAKKKRPDCIVSQDGLTIN